MTLNYIKIKNFRNFEGETEIKFNENINVILGNNDTGKTNIVNAISWCLYGEELVNTHENNHFDIININANDVYVECGFTIGGKDFIVSRKYSNNKCEVVFDYGDKLFNVEEIISKNDFINNFFTGEFPVDLNELSKEDEEKLNRLMARFFTEDCYTVRDGDVYDNDKLMSGYLSAGDSLIISLFAKFVSVNGDFPLIFEQIFARLDNNKKKSAINSLMYYDSQIILLLSESMCDECLEENVVLNLNK